ncbi:MAG: short-chain dehydrogenase [Bacteroidota bacterium]|nr:short-chain dehydrogenase [Bacteroidota bacterium]
MTPDNIEKYVEETSRKNSIINVSFKERNVLTGIFVRGTDYDELKKKNFWRIVSIANLDNWNATKNINLSKLYNGISFTKLSDSKS